MRELAETRHLTRAVIAAVRRGEVPESVAARLHHPLDSIERLMRSPLVVALAHLGGSH